MFHGGRAGAGIPSPKLCITVIRTLLVPSGLGLPRSALQTIEFGFKLETATTPMNGPFPRSKTHHHLAEGRKIQGFLP